MPRDTTAGWEVDESGISVTSPLGEICDMSGGRDEATFDLEEMEAHARLIAAAPTHALVGRLLASKVLGWQEFGLSSKGEGELVFNGIRHAAGLDEFGVPTLTDNLRSLIRNAAIAKAEGRV